VLELRFCGGVEVRVDGRVLPDALVGGRQGRLVLAYLACERSRPVRREELAELLWPDELPDSWVTSLSAVVSRLRRLFAEAGLDGGQTLVSTPGAYQLVLPVTARVDLDELADLVMTAEDAAERGDAEAADVAAQRAEMIAGPGFVGDDGEWVDSRRAVVADLRVRALLALAEAQLGAGRASRAVDLARQALQLGEAREATYRLLMRALADAGERAEALRVWERCRITLVEELGVDPSPETEAVYLSLLEPASLAAAAPAPATALPSGVVTFLLTDIVESSALWEDAAPAMAVALERHDAIIADVVAGNGGTFLKSKLEGDATVSVFARATECAAAAVTLLDAFASEPWPEGARPRLRIALHTGEAFERDGDYFGPALNRAARLRALAGPGEVLLSQAVAELVRDQLAPEVVLHDRGMQPLRGLSRGENVFTLARVEPDARAPDEPIGPGPDLERPDVPAALAPIGPFVGRAEELATLDELWRRACGGEAGVVFIGGEPGVGKSRLSAELAARAHAGGGLVLYGRCDEDLAAPLQPFIEAVRELAPAMGAARLRAVRGVDELTRVVPELTELLGEQPGLRADPDTERLALFDASTQLLVAAADALPTVLVLDDLHWAGKTTLSLLRHVLRGTKTSRLLVVGTYRDTELARTHPLAETLADLRRDPDIRRISLGGLADADVDAYLAAIGNDDRALGRELAGVTAGNPFFLIEVIRHVEESGGVWQKGSLPEGVRETTGRRLSRLSEDANTALTVAAVVGATFDLALVEDVCGLDLVDAIAEAVAAGLVVEEPGALARFRFAHAIVRQVLLSELVSLKRVRLHRTIAERLEAGAATTDADARLLDLAHHWFECASTGSADQAVAACGRAANRAMERLAYEEAGDLYGMALQAQEWVADADSDVTAALHLARCDALLTAGDVAGARDAIDALEAVAGGSERLAAWYTTYEGLLAVLGEPERLTEIVQSIGAAAGAMRDAGDRTGEAKARYVHALALERLGRIGPAERALDEALAAARAADDRRLADTVLAEAPPAHLWGPTPVTRASGRCLDVVRVLRITSGTRAVHAVALRCQAVLEALRGRTDAARRLIASSHRTVERLGLTHRRLETEMAAGLIELLDGEAAAAEVLLRSAFEGLHERGLDGEAAQAAAFLGRALLLLDRVDEADAAAAQAAELAGSDLKAAITWRDVRARVAVRRGDLDRARDLAGAAVELAGATDALLLVADAHLTLAEVLRAAGDAAGAAAETRRALDACEAKGATVLADAARAALGELAPGELAPGAPSADAPAPTTSGSNLATATMDVFADAFNRGDWDAVAASHTDRWRVDDRRPIVGMESREDDAMFSGVFAQSGGGRLEHEVVATRGERLALGRWRLASPEMEVPFLAITRVDDDGRGEEFVMFEPEATAEATAALDRMAALAAFDNEATSTARRLEVAFNAGDRETVAALYADGFTLTERRTLARNVFDHDDSVAQLRFIVDNGATLGTEFLATRGRRLFLARTTLRVPDPEATAVVLVVSEVDEHGRYIRSVSFDAEDLDGAFAELDRMFLAGEGAASPSPTRWFDNDATRALARLHAAVHDRDWDNVMAGVADDYALADHRSVPGTSLDHAEALESLRIVFAGGGRFEDEVLATRGRTLALVRITLRLEEPDAVGTILSVVSADGSGRLTTPTIFDPDDVHRARAELDRRFLAGEGAVHAEVLDPAARPNRAWRAARRHADAYETGDRDAYLAATDPGFVYVDHRTGIQIGFEGTAAIDAMREGFGLDEVRYEREPVATRGDDLVVTRDRFWFVDRDAGPSEVRNLALVESGPDGRVRGHTAFDPDQLDAAIVALDARWAEIRERGDDGNTAWRRLLALSDAMHRKDEPGVLAVIAADFVSHDHRAGVRLLLDGDDALHVYRSAMALDHFREVHTLAATRGDQLALSRAVGVFGDGAVGPSEIESLVLVETGSDGRIAAVESFDPHDLGVAIAALDARWAAFGERRENAAWRAHRGQVDAGNRRDWEAFMASIAPGFALDDRRGGVHRRFAGDEALAAMRVLFGVDDLVWSSELLASRGELLVTTRDVVQLTDGVVGPAEVSTVTVVECDEEGRISGAIHFEPDDVDRAIAALGARHAELLTQQNTTASRAQLAFSDAWLAASRGTGEWSQIRALLHPGYVNVDRRRGVHLRLEGEDAVRVHEHAVGLADVRIVFSVLAARGDRLVLARNLVSFVGADADADADAVDAEVAFLSLAECAPDGLIASHTIFEVDQLDDALEVLEARHRELAADRSGVVAAANDAWRARRRQMDTCNRRDWAGFVDTMAEGFVLDDRRLGVRRRFSGEDAVTEERALFELDDSWWDSELLATRGDRLAVTRDVVGFRDGEVGPAEIASVAVVESDGRGRAVTVTAFELDDEHEAFTLLATRHAELDASGARVERADTVAWRVALRQAQVSNRRDWQGLRDLAAPGYVYADLRRLLSMELDGEGVLGAIETAMRLDDCRWNRELVATRGDRLALTRDVFRLSDADVGDAEVVSLALTECSPDGRIVAQTVFDVDDEREAFARLDARHTVLEAPGRRAEPSDTVAWRVAQLQAEGSNRRDRQGVRDLTAPAFVYADLRRGLRMELDGEEALDAIETAMRLDDVHWDRELVATRGERLVLTHDVVRFTDGAVGTAETESVSVNECDEGGRLVAVTSFDVEDLPRAFELLDDRHRAQRRREEVAPSENNAWRATARLRDCASRGDWDGFVASVGVGYVQTDLRRGLGLRLAGEDALAMNRIMFGLTNFRWEIELLATRGERLAMTRDVVRFVDGATGPSEVETVNVEESGPDGRLVAITMFDPDDRERATAVLEARHEELEQH
jgi:DNA-binding SARP family transcriptional activator/tetratricopeptide (TPR) repeat protein